jgi:hypothetical protein
MIIVVVPFMKHAGMALYPFILVSRPEYKVDAVLIRHEQIHLQQQLELLILPFYLLYFFNYVFNLCRYRDHDKAYLQIRFEREAYQHEKDPDYLNRRRIWAWLRH